MADRYRVTGLPRARLSFGGARQPQTRKAAEETAEAAEEAAKAEADKAEKLAKKEADKAEKQAKREADWQKTQEDVGNALNDVKESINSIFTPKDKEEAEAAEETMEETVEEVKEETKED